MKYDIICNVYGNYFHSICKPQLKKQGLNDNILNEIKKEYKNIVLRAKTIKNPTLFSVYLMCAYFISLNRNTNFTAQKNYEILENGLCKSKLFHISMGNANSYLNKNKMPKRKKLSQISKLKQYENDWVFDVLDKTSDYDLGYNYYECGICKLCKDEKCFELAKYLCKLDFLFAETMGMQLYRTKTIAEGFDFCDFRFKKK